MLASRQPGIRITFRRIPAPRDVPRLRDTAGVKIVEGPENRAVFTGMDRHRDELLHGSVKDRNPFKDGRVRRALYQAIDIEMMPRATCFPKLEKWDASRHMLYWGGAVSDAETTLVPVMRNPGPKGEGLHNHRRSRNKGSTRWRRRARPRATRRIARR